MTVERLAAKAEIASATVYRAERGEQRATEATLVALAAVLAVSVDDLRHAKDATAPDNGRGHDPQKTPAPDLPPSGGSRVDGEKAGAR